MADKDAVTKKYMSIEENFADAFNYLLYNGEQRIKPGDLRVLDTSSVEVPYGEDDAELIIQPIQRARDVYKQVMAMETQNAVLMLLGVENQSDVHYAMPVRNALYDLMEYAGQVQKAARSHRRSESKKSGGQFLSGFYKRDRLIPVITLVIYWGADEWDGPLTLHEMLNVDDPVILDYCNDYKINLIQPARMGEEDFAKFKSHLGDVLRLIKASGNSEKLEQVVRDDVYKHMDNDDAVLIKGILDVDIGVDNGEEEKDMCKAVQDLQERAIETGRKLEKVEFVENLLRMNKLSIEDIAIASRISVEEVEEIDRRRSA